MPLYHMRCEIYAISKHDKFLRQAVRVLADKMIPSEMHFDVFISVIIPELDALSSAYVAGEVVFREMGE
jgi:hypothetical protein